MESQYVTSLSDYKLTYLKEFELKNRHITVPPEKLYEIIASTLTKLREPISKAEFVSYYNGTHLVRINLPDEDKLENKDLSYSQKKPAHQYLSNQTLSADKIDTEGESINNVKLTPDKSVKKQEQVKGGFSNIFIYQSAHKAFINGKYVKAKKGFKQCLDSSYEVEECKVFLAKICLELKEYKESYDYFSLCIHSKHPCLDLSHYYHRGVCSYYLGEYYDAWVDSKRIVDLLASTDERAVAKRDELQKINGDLTNDMVKLHHESRLKHIVNSLKVYNNRSNLSGEISSKDAIKIYRFLQDNLLNPWTTNQMYESFIKINSSSQQIDLKVFTDFFRLLYPDHYEKYNFEGHYYEGADFETTYRNSINSFEDVYESDAIMYCQSAMRGRDKSLKIKFGSYIYKCYENEAKYLFLIGESVRALESYMNLLINFPKAPHIYFCLAVVEYKLKKYDSAINSLMSAKKKFEGCDSKQIKEYADTYVREFFEEGFIYGCDYLIKDFSKAKP